MFDRKRISANPNSTLTLNLKHNNVFRLQNDVNFRESAEDCLLTLEVLNLRITRSNLTLIFNSSFEVEFSSQVDSI